MRPNLPLGGCSHNPPTLKPLISKALGTFGRMGGSFAVLRSVCARMRINDHIKISSHPPKSSHSFKMANKNRYLWHVRINQGWEDGPLGWEVTRSSARPRGSFPPPLALRAGATPRYR